MRFVAIFAFLGALGATVLSVPALAETPNMPLVLRVPDSAQLPLGSALREGTEYIDLDRAGYVEEEYYMSGAAPAITAAGETLFDAPYTTRILVRKPQDPAKFNGTVIIEPFTWFGERGAGWILTRDYLVRQGYAYVGYTLNINRPEPDPKFAGWSPEEAAPYLGIVNFEFMRDYDYARYAPLGFYFDPARFERGGAVDPFVPQSQGVGAQLALLLKSNDPHGPMAGLDVERVYVNSWAVTAQVWMDYVDQGRHQQWRMPDGSALIDAYMTGRMAHGEVGGEILRIPRKMPADTPFVTVFTQSELNHDVVNGIPAPQDSDDPQLRFYEVTGLPHLRLADVGTGEIEPTAQDVGRGDDPMCTTLYDEPVEYVASALLDGMDKWVRNGTPMPRAERVQRMGNTAVRDEVTGNLVGGVRPPWIVVPSAVYMVAEEAGCGIVLDTKLPYSAERLRAMYGTYANYERQYEEAKADFVEQGYLLPADAEKLEPIASPDDFRSSE